MTADISSNVAEKAVCWCDGRKNRRSLFMGRRFICAGREFPSKPTRGSHRDGVYRLNQTAMVPLLTLERTVSICRRKSRSIKRVRHMISRGNRLREKDFPVDLELSRI